MCAAQTRDPHAKKWHVHGWPKIYILDHKGVIRFKNKRESALDKAVDQLLGEMEAEVGSHDRSQRPAQGA
jgi:hypothetical protein